VTAEDTLKELSFGFPQAALLYGVVGLIAGTYVYATQKRRTSLSAFGAKGNQAHRRSLKTALMLCAFSCLVFALVRPMVAVPTHTFNPGRDIVFMLDVSRSMLAPDLQPNRLNSSKSAILDLVNSIHNTRIGLVAFGGEAEVLCPLTEDIQYFRAALDQATSASIDAPGTSLMPSLRTTVESAFDDLAGRSRHLVMFTDGDDLGPATLQPARRLPELGIDLIAVGVGDRSRGSRIPSGTMFVKWQGADVWSRLNALRLRELCDAARGIYFEVGTDPSRLGELRRLLSRKSPVRLAESAASKRELYQLPLFAALLLLITEMLIPERRGS
jgi:Ca-activated chloride channel homolog